MRHWSTIRFWNQSAAINAVQWNHRRICKLPSGACKRSWWQSQPSKLHNKVYSIRQTGLMHSSVVSLNCIPKLTTICEWEMLEIFATSFASYMYINTCNIFEPKFATYMYASKSHTLCDKMMHLILVGETVNKKGGIFNCSNHVYCQCFWWDRRFAYFVIG